MHHSRDEQLLVQYGQFSVLGLYPLSQIKSLSSMANTTVVNYPLYRDFVTVDTTGLISRTCFRKAFHEPFWHPW